MPAPGKSPPRSRARCRRRAGPVVPARRSDFNVVGMVAGPTTRCAGCTTACRHAPRRLCGLSDRALLLLEAVSRQNPDPRSWCSGTARRAASSGAPSRRRGRHPHAPATRDQVRFSINKLVARRPGPDCVTRGAGEAHLRPRAQGRLRQDARRRTSPWPSPNAGEGRDRRPRPPVRRRRACLGLGPERPSTTSRSPAERSTPRSSTLLDDPLDRRPRAARTHAPRPGELGHGRADPRGLRDPPRRLRRRHRRHAARVHGRGDRDDRRRHRPRSWSACSTRSR